jgi:two-component system alkaline phosphatase synthesis response regulator PhoP
LSIGILHYITKGDYIIAMQEKHKIILLVEDEVPMLSVLDDTLTQNGFQTLKAKNGEQGLDLALKEHPSLILLDVFMPKMDGLELMDRLRQDEWGKTVPVIVLTNISPDTDETLQAIIKNQPAYYLMKADIKLVDIVEKIKEVLSKSQV